MVSTFINLIFSILYNIVISPLLLLVDILQSLFMAFAGIGTIHRGHDTITSGNTGADNDTGLVYYLLRSATVRNLFFSLLTLAIVLLVFFTLLAFLRNMYQEKPKPPKEIIMNAMRGLMAFAMTPILCLLGVWIANVLLQALNQATNEGGTELMSGYVFTAGAYNANRFRTTGGAIDNYLYNQLQGYYGGNLPKPSNPIKKGDGDDAKVVGYNLTPAEMEYYADYADKLYRDRTLSIQTQVTIVIFYDMTQINYVVLIVGAIYMLYALGSMTFGCIQRAFYLVFLFALSPLMDALYPWDDGNAAKNSMKEFYKQTISIYGAVVGLNLFFAILPLFTGLAFNDYLYILTADVQGLLSIILLICGLYTVKSLITLITSYIGGGDVFGSGATLMSNVKSQAGKIGKGAAVVAGAFGAMYGRHQVRKKAFEDAGGKKLDKDDMNKQAESAGEQWEKSQIAAFRNDNGRAPTSDEMAAIKQERKKTEKKAKKDYKENWNKEHKASNKKARIESKKAAGSPVGDLAKGAGLGLLGIVDKTLGLGVADIVGAAGEGNKKAQEDASKKRSVDEINKAAKDAVDKLNDGNTTLESVTKAIEAINKHSDEEKRTKLMQQLLDKIEKGVTTESKDEKGNITGTEKSGLTDGQKAVRAALVGSNGAIDTSMSSSDALTALNTRSNIESMEKRFNDKQAEYKAEQAKAAAQERYNKAKKGEAGDKERAAAQADFVAAGGVGRVEDAEISVEGARAAAERVGKELQRYLESHQETTHSNDEFGKYTDSLASKIDASLAKYMKGKDSDKSAEQQAAMAKSLKDLAKAMSELPKQIAQEIDKGKKKGKGGSGDAGSGSGPK